MLDTMRAEGRKIGGLPVVPLMLLATVVTTVGLAAISSASMAGLLSDDPDMAGSYFTPEDQALQAVYFGQIGMVAFGALAIGGEYGGSQLRTSLLAVPARGRFLAAKAGVIALLALVTAAVTIPSAIAVTQIALGEYGLPSVRTVGTRPAGGHGGCGPLLDPAGSPGRRGDRHRP